MAINKHFQGSDIIIDMTWYDADNAILRPSTLNGYTGELRLRGKPNNIVLNFSEGDFEVTDDILGEVRLRVDRSTTENLAIGVYELFLNFLVPDFDAEDGSRVEIVEVTPFQIIEF